MKTMKNILMIILPFLNIFIQIGCVKDAPFKFENSTAPEYLNDGWEVASLEDVGIDQLILDEITSRLVSEDQYFNVKSLIIVKDGKLVYETYFRTPAERCRYGHVQSVTKSITSLIFGIIKSDGYIDSLNQTLYSIISDKFPYGDSKRLITLRNLLTMSSGLSFDNDVFSLEIYGDKPDDPVKYILNKPLYALPGELFYYRDCDPHLISYVIQRLTGKSEEQCVKEYIFEPLGINDYYWDSDHTNTTTGAYGLHLKPRDMAKIGQLVLDHGRWNGAQIVDSTWISTSTQKHIETSFQTEPYIYEYGFYWWIVPRWKAFTAWGQGGNFIFIVPGQGMVLIMSSMPDVDDDVVGTKLQDFEGLVRPLLVNGAP